MNTRIMITILVLIHSSYIPGRKHYDSDASFENVVVYKDCKYKTKEPQVTTVATPAAPTFQKLRAPTRPNQCMSCCTMCCNIQKSLRSPDFGDYDGMMQPQEPIQLQRSPPQEEVPNMESPITPPNTPVRLRRKKKMRQIAPINSGRRSMGQTREHIKLLLSRDEEMKKILHELVRVTIQKITLLDRMKTDEENDDDDDE